MVQIARYDFRLIRGVLGITRIQMAERLNCSAASVYLIERGERSITPPMEKALRRVIREENIRGQIQRLTKLAKGAEIETDAH